MHVQLPVWVEYEPLRHGMQFEKPSPGENCRRPESLLLGLPQQDKSILFGGMVDGEGAQVTEARAPGQESRRNDS